MHKRKKHPFQHDMMTSMNVLIAVHHRIVDHKHDFVHFVDDRDHK
jgi:hypothetical protein